MRFPFALALACTGFLFAAVVKPSTSDERPTVFGTLFDANQYVATIGTMVESDLETFHASFEAQIKEITLKFFTFIYVQNAFVLLSLNCPLVFDKDAATKILDKRRQELVDEYRKLELLVDEINTSITKTIYANVKSAIQGSNSAGLDVDTMPIQDIAWYSFELKRQLQSLTNQNALFYADYTNMDNSFQKHMESLHQTIEAKDLKFQELNVNDSKAWDILHQQINAAATQNYKNILLVQSFLLDTALQYFKSRVALVANEAMIDSLSQLTHNLSPLRPKHSKLQDMHARNQSKLVQE